MKYLLPIFLVIACATQSFAQEMDESTDTGCIFPAMPEYPGDLDSLKSFIDKNFNWVQGQMTIAGKVFVQFDVDEEGVISNVTVVKGLCETCDAEAVRLMKLMPNWIPAMDKGVACKSKMIMPIKFDL
jgi:TonB family protein